MSSLAYTLLEDMLVSISLGLYDRAGSQVVMNGAGSPRKPLNPLQGSLHVLQNVSATVALGCALASMFLEEHQVGGLKYRVGLSPLVGGWKNCMRSLDLAQGLLMCLIGALQGISTLSMVS